MAHIRVGAAGGRAASGGGFIRHYVEMVLAMAAGMPFFGLLLVSPLDPLGYRETLQQHPYVRELVMFAFMSVPMVGLMAYRGHSPQLAVEMLLGMWLPAVAVVLLTASALVPFLQPDTAMTAASHLVMLPGMFLAMWVRRAEYSGHHGHHEHGSGARSAPDEAHASH